jgi:ubiquinone/menaquinone biosynthesis C-methylase UbiE
LPATTDGELRYRTRSEHEAFERVAKKGQLTPDSELLDVGCGCGAPTLEFARAVGRTGRVAALDISGPMLAEGAARAKAAGIANIDWRACVCPVRCG